MATFSNFMRSGSAAENGIIQQFPAIRMAKVLNPGNSAFAIPASHTGCTATTGAEVQALYRYITGHQG